MSRDVVGVGSRTGVTGGRGLDRGTKEEQEYRFVSGSEPCLREDSSIIPSVRSGTGRDPESKGSTFLPTGSSREKRHIIVDPVDTDHL